MHDPHPDSPAIVPQVSGRSFGRRDVHDNRAGDDVHELKCTVEPSKQPGPNDRLQIATIGTGIIGFIDTTCALKVPGVELVAACDVYEGRRTHVKEVFGDKVETYVDYREILAAQRCRRGVDLCSRPLACADVDRRHEGR